MRASGTAAKAHGYWLSGRFPNGARGADLLWLEAAARNFSGRIVIGRDPMER